MAALKLEIERGKDALLRHSVGEPVMLAVVSTRFLCHAAYEHASKRGVAALCLSRDWCVEFSE